ncbi:MAG TPA: hypothetical protein DDZ84_01160 [Firmicutes bacterium]|nr:hypothetical protein [Bacillota bacterium]
MLKGVLAAVLFTMLASRGLGLVGRCAGGSGAGTDADADGAAAIGELGYAACITMRVFPEAWICQPTGSMPGSEPGSGWTAPAILEQGMMIRPGARVTTGPRGRVLLVFADGSTVTIESSSDLVIGPRSLQLAPVAGSICEPGGGQLLRLVPPQIRLIIGGIWLEIARRIDSGPSFEVETPSSTVSVRGTAFCVEVDDEETTYVYVESGQVMVESESGTLTVDPGQSAVAQKGKCPEAAPEPRPRGKPSWVETGNGKPGDDKPGNGPKDKERPLKKTGRDGKDEEGGRGDNGRRPTHDLGRH